MLIPQLHTLFILLVLRHRLRRLISLIWLRLLSVPALRRLSLLRLILQRYLCSSSSAIHLLLYVGSVFDILSELADVAGNRVPGLQTEGDERDEAKGEPFPVTRVVSFASRIGSTLMAGKDEAYQRFTTLPLWFPQFWHWTVMFS